MSQPNRAFFKSSDALLYYEDYPASHPDTHVIIFLHGNGEDHSYFSNQISCFSPQYRLVLMDTRAQGKSSFGKQKLDFSLFADDLLGLMDTLNIRKAHLLGFSDGGNIALTFALSHPERVSSLILNGANLSPSGVRFFTQFPIVLGYWCCKLFAPFSKKAEHNGAVLGLMVNHPHIHPENLKILTMPSLVIVGEKDMIKDSHSLLIAKSLPNSQFVRLKEADHFCALKHPKEFNLAVSDFLNSLS